MNINNDINIQYGEEAIKSDEAIIKGIIPIINDNPQCILSPANSITDTLRIKNTNCKIFDMEYQISSLFSFKVKLNNLIYKFPYPRIWR